MRKTLKSEARISGRMSISRQKKHRKRSIYMRVGAFFLALNMCFWLLPIGLFTAHAEGGVFITEIALMEGDMGTLSLEESGYSFIEQPLNPAGTSDLYLGYRTGGESSAIHDLIVSTNGSGSIEVDGHSYSKVSDLSLNEGAGGSALYLYASYDAETGGALRGLNYLVKKSPDGLSDDSSVLASDGSEVVTTDEGKVADFDEGIGGSELYLRMYKGNLYRPYVEKVTVATADSEEAAIAELAGKRCTYYVNYDIGDEKSVYVGYTRTDDEEKALRGLVAIGGDAGEIAEAADGSGQSGDEDFDDGQPGDEDSVDLIIHEGSKEGEIEIKGVSYAPVEGGEVKADKKYTFYYTTDAMAGEPVIDLIACGYDPEEFGLKNLNKEKDSEETEEPEESEDDSAKDDSDDTGGSDNDGQSRDDSDESGDEMDRSEDSDAHSDSDASGSDEPGSDQAEEPAGDNPEGTGDTDNSDTETVSDSTAGNRALGMLCVVGLNATVQSPQDESVEKVADTGDASDLSGDSVGDDVETNGGDSDSYDRSDSDTSDAGESLDTSGSQDDTDDAGRSDGASADEEDGSSENDDNTDDEDDSTDEENPDEASETKLAKAYRIYTEISTKEWISGYFLRGGGQTASKYLYDEDEYMTASNSDETLWISNIYCSDKKGRQFTNCIGYVTKPGEADSTPFDVTLTYDEAGDSKGKKDDPESTASVFGMGIGQLVMCGMFGAILVGVIVSLAYKLRKNSNTQKM